MAFIIQRPTVHEILAFDDEAIYDFEADGILKVTDGNRVTYYSPNAWDWVSSDNGHKPKQMGRPGHKPAAPRSG